jgi:hypothetical protein
MRCALTILLLTFTSNIDAQNQYSPFVGGFEFGIGYSSIIDFNRENNIKYNRDLKLEQLFLLFPFIPYQFGFVTAKYFDSKRYGELGIIFRKTSVGWIQIHPFGWGLPGINFYSFDFPMKYYFPTRGIKIGNDAYIGIIPSWLYNPSVIGSDPYDSNSEDYFRKGYLSVCSGLYKEKNNSRLKLHTSLAISSVIKPAYRQEIPADERAYGGVMFPFEILFCWAYIMK